jgi:hypothetical protein
MKRLTMAIFLALCVGACENQSDADANWATSGSYDVFLEHLAEAYVGKPAPFSRAYALIKDGTYGPDWLLTVHGLADNKAACEEIIEPYNKDPSLSSFPGTYYCEEINSDFRADSFSLRE